MHATRASGPIRWISIAAFATWLLLCAATYEALPGLQHAWALNLVRYLPDWAAWLVLLMGLLSTTEEARRGVIAAVGWLAERRRTLSPRARWALDLGGLFVLLWLLRPRVLPGDENIGLSILVGPDRVPPPDAGGVVLLAGLTALGRALGLAPVVLPQLATSAAGALAIAATCRAAPMAAPQGEAREATTPLPSAGLEGAAIPLLAFSGGIGVSLAGHFEPRAFQLAAFALYLLAGLRELERGVGSRRAALCLAALLVLDPFGLLLLPSLAFLERRVGRAPWRAIGLAVGPLALYLVLAVAVHARATPPIETLTGVLGLSRLLPVFGDASGVGTDFGLFSHAHLKYLANAAFLLVAGSAVLAAAGLAVRRGRAGGVPRLGFLALATAGLFAGACGIRPLWGPLDWEILAGTGLALAFLAGALLSPLEPAVRLHLAVAVAGLQLCFVGVPLIAIGFGPSVASGPFHARYFDPRLPAKGHAPSPRLAPWL